MKKADNFDASKWLVENKITTQSRLNENKIEGVDVEVDDNMITLSGDSGDYDGFVEDDGTVSFTVTNDEEEFNDQNWKDILGDDHMFVKIANAIPTKAEALDDYVMITVKASDLTSMNESRLNEDVFFPYQIDDERGRELYTKYNKASENPAWKNIDGNYELEIDLKTLLKITGMTLDELKELSDNYGDESWSIYVDKNKSTVTQTND